MKKYKMFYQAAALVLAAVLATGMLSSCTVKDSGILMGIDTFINILSIDHLIGV